MAWDDSGEGFPPGSEELRDHNRLPLSTGHPGRDPASSTQPDDSVEDVNVPPESSSHSACQDKETKREVEEHVRRGIGDGEPEEPKVKGGGRVGRGHRHAPVVVKQLHG